MWLDIPCITNYYLNPIHHVVETTVDGCFRGTLTLTLILTILEFKVLTVDTRYVMRKNEKDIDNKIKLNTSDLQTS